MIGCLVDAPQPCEAVVGQCGSGNYSEGFTDSRVKFRDQSRTLFRAIKFLFLVACRKKKEYR